jgi:hypothetical protein
MNWFELPPEDLKKYINAYLAQRNKCDKDRKIDRLGNFVKMKLTFQEWMQIWWDSGHLAKRHCHGYVMARTNDTGHYEVGNVRICFWIENVAEAGRSLAKIGAANKVSNSHPCTVDGETIYESQTALVKALGHGKKGRRSPNFRYVYSSLFRFPVNQIKS